jgi:acyl-CoA reductase-like NAD-dependent aldehyde dehydrogenase
MLTTEQGKPLHESRRELAAFSDVFRYYSRMSRPERVVKDDQSARVEVAAEPIGPCALILPWNYPVGILAWKLAPCLLAGNTAIVKPSPYAPLTVLDVLRLAAPHLPDRVALGMPGGDDAGRVLVAASEVKKISFTGSREAGREIMSTASGRFASVTLEMGGNDAAIIMPDCDLGKRFDSIFWGCFFNAGQICIAIKRVYAHESIAGELMRRFRDKANALVVGNGLDAGTQMGPLNNERQLQKVERMVLTAADNGASVIAGGSRYQDARKSGYFYMPTVIADADEHLELVREEQFGPAVPILTYYDIDDAVARANSTDYGLGGSAWGEDAAKAREIAGRLECGTAWVNSHMLVEYAAPFGGVKRSGMGRELGTQGLEGFMAERTLHIRK